MNRLFVVGLFAVAASLPVTAQAEGSRMPAGGNLNSSYVDHPHHDPRSLWSQRNGTGQILGAPMLHENAGAPTVARRGVVAPRWATGSVPTRRSR